MLGKDNCTVFYWGSWGYKISLLDRNQTGVLPLYSLILTVGTCHLLWEGSLSSLFLYFLTCLLVTSFPFCCYNVTIQKMNGINDDFIDSCTFWCIPFINSQITAAVMYHVGAIDLIRCKWCAVLIMNWHELNKWGWLICISSAVKFYLRFPAQLQPEADWLMHQAELYMPKLCVWGVVLKLCLS